MFRREAASFNEAIEKFKKAVTLDGDYETVYLNWGSCLAALADMTGDINKHNEAIEKYEKAIELKSDFAEAYLNWGKSLARLAELNGDLEKHMEAIKKLNKAIELKSDFAAAYLSLGNVIVMTGSIKNYELACGIYEKAAELQSDYTEVYFRWGLALYQLARLNDDVEKLTEAIQAFRKTIELKRDHARAYFNMGLISAGLASTTDDITAKEEASYFFTTAYLFFIIKKEWSEAYQCIIPELFRLSRPLKTGFYYILGLICKTALLFLFKPNQLSDENLLELEEWKKTLNTESAHDPVIIIINAILENICHRQDKTTSIPPG